MAHIAFLGLGRMGTPMATRLLRAGNTLACWNRTSSATAPLTSLGAAAAPTPAAAVAGAQVVVTMLSDATAVESVLFGDPAAVPDAGAASGAAGGSDAGAGSDAATASGSGAASGAVAGLGDGALLIEMSTVGPDAVARIRGRLPAGVRMVDAPVRGSVPAAESGELEIYVGGEAAHVADCRDLLGALGRVHHVGPLGTAAGLKLVLNAVGMSSLVLVSEALRIAERLGVPAEAALRELAPLAPAADRIRRRREQLERPVHFTVALARKDLDLALRDGVGADNLHDGAGADDLLAAGMIAAARQRLAAATDAGLGDTDITDYLGGIR